MRDKKLVIYPGVDLARAIRCYHLYAATESAGKLGFASAKWYGMSPPTDEESELCVYSTRTQIVIRQYDITEDGMIERVADD